MRFRRDRTKWILGVLVGLWAPYVQGASVWVSTAIPSSLFTVGGLDITADQSGELWATFSQYSLYVKRFVCAKTSGATWSIEALNYSDLTYNDIGTDRQIVIDSQGTPHISVTSAGRLFHVSKPFSDWEIDITPRLGTIPEDSLAIDKSDGVHMAHIEAYYPDLPFDDLFYEKKSNSGWSSELVFRVENMNASNARSLHVSLDVGPAGTPTIALAGSKDDPIRILSKQGATWTVLQTLSGPWWWPTLRIDKMDRIHLVMSSTSTTNTVRYVLMNSSGVIQNQYDYPLPDVIFYGNPPTTSIALDQNDQAHIAVENVYINPAGDVTHPAMDYSESKIALVQGDHPYILGINSNILDKSVKVMALLDTPGTVQFVSRSTHSLTWSFVPASAPLGHRLLRTSDGNDVSGLLGPTATTFTQNGMAPNASQQLTARAVFPGFFMDSAPGATMHTLCVSPLDLQIFRPSNNAISLSWTPGGNTEGTLYRLRLIPSQGTGIVCKPRLRNVQIPPVVNVQEGVTGRGCGAGGR